MENYSFFDLGIFGDVMPVEEEKKEKKEKKSKNSSSKPAPKVELFKAPLKLVFDSLKTVEIKEGEFTKEQLLAEVSQQTGVVVFEKEANLFKISKLAEGIYLTRPGNQTKQEKGSAEGKNFLIGISLPVDGLFEPAEGAEEVTVQDVKKHIKDSYGVDVDLYLAGDTFFPVPQMKGHNLEMKKISFPFKIMTLNLEGEMIELSEEDYKKYSSSDEKGQFSFTEEVEVPKVEDKSLRKVLEKLLPDYKADLDFCFNEEAGILIVGHKVFGDTASAAAKAEKMYPTDVEVSLVFTKLKLTPELFGGKKEVTGKELLKYIGKTYPEYSPERTEILYDEKKKLIIPILKSGKRGAYYLEESSEYRKEETDLMSITATKGRRDLHGCVKGEVKLNLPKIPFSILKETVSFFWDVYVTRKTEAIALIFWNREEEKYELHIPKQRAFSFEVTFERDTELEIDPNRILVLEIHSHGRFDAFWSDTDNSDEKAHRLYGVVGKLESFEYDEKHIIVRASTGGYRVRMNLMQVFEKPAKEDFPHFSCFQ